MPNWKEALALALLACGPEPLCAQDAQEIVVTASRKELFDDDDRSAAIPAIGLRRTADFAIQEVRIAGDTRDAPQRRKEIFATLKGAIELARQRGDIELATGDIVVEPLTLANYENLALHGEGRADAEQLVFYVKTKLTASATSKAAIDRITAFIKAVPTVGRAQMLPLGDLTLSIVGPDQYRSQIVELVAADIRSVVSKMGPDYAVEAKGLDKPIEWVRAGLTEVFLYLPYSFTVRPKGGS